MEQKVKKKRCKKKGRQNSKKKGKTVSLKGGQSKLTKEGSTTNLHVVVEERNKKGKENLDQ